MWTGSTTWSRLQRDSRWTVELHAARGSAPRSARFPRVRLEQLVRRRRESLVPSRWPDFPFAYLGLEHVTGQSGLLAGFSATPGRAVKSPSAVFRSGDVLYARLRPYLNKVYAALPPVHTGICSGEFFVLVPDPARVRPLFLRELLASAEVQDHVRHMQFGSALPRLQVEDLLAIEVAAPPLEVQAEIEARLMLARSELAQARAAAERLPAEIRASFERCIRNGKRLSLRSVVEPSAVDMGSGLPEDYVPTKQQRRGKRSR